MPVNLVKYNDSSNSDNIAPNPTASIPIPVKGDPLADIKDAEFGQSMIGDLDVRDLEETIVRDTNNAIRQLDKYTKDIMVPSLPANGGSQNTGIPSMDTGIPAPTGRPPGDNRSAEQIINDSPVARNLGNQKDIGRDNLKKQVGDWENDPDPKKRADAAYNLVQVLEYIDNSESADGSSRGDGDGDINGITSKGEARHGTEAGVLKDFGEQGYSFFDGSHRLPTTSDSHVRADGSSMNNVQWFAGKVGDALGAIPVVGNTPFVKALQSTKESDGSFGGMLKAGVKGAANSVISDVKGVASSVLPGVGGILDPTAAAGQTGGSMTDPTTALLVSDKIYGPGLGDLTK